MPEGNLYEPPEGPAPPLTSGQKKFMAVTGLLLAAAGIAGAAYLYLSGAFDNRPAFQQGWAYCDAGEGCTAIPAPCGSWIAVNNRSLSDARAYYDHMIELVESSPQMHCATAPHGAARPEAYCLSGLCMTRE